MYATIIESHLHQSLGVTNHDLAPNLGIETEFIERLDVRRDRRQWRIVPMPGFNDRFLVPIVRLPRDWALAGL